MNKVLRRASWALAVIALAAIAAATAGAGVFDGVSSTAAGYSTWDADQADAEGLAQTGAGVYVAVLDTGLTPNWKDYFPAPRVNTALGTGFEQSVTLKARTDDPCGLSAEVGSLRQSTWVGSSSSTHGTHVTSTILGFFYDSNFDTVSGQSTPPAIVRGIAPDVTVIPVKVLADYQFPARPACTDSNIDTSSHVENFGTDAMVAAGINYVASLAEGGLKPLVINMSLGGGALDPVEKKAIDRAIKAGVIVVAAAGNDGELGMHYPGAYAPVISAGATGWTKEWLKADGQPTDRLWWLKGAPGTQPASGDVAEGKAGLDELYVADFSSRELAGQELDVLAPGSWVRGPYPGSPGYAHLPWWSNGWGDIRGLNPSNFLYVGGTSMSTPHVSATAAMMLQKNPSLTQAKVESILKSTALPVRSSGSKVIWDRGLAVPAWSTVSWDTKCSDGTTTQSCDPVGSGLLQAKAALAAAG